MSRTVSVRGVLVVGSVCAFSLLSCGREPTGLGGAGEGMRYSHGIGFQTEFPSGYTAWRAAQQALNQQLPQANQVADPGAYSRVRVALRFPDGTVAKDTVIDFPAGVTEVALPLSILLPASAPTSGVTLAGELQYQNASGATIWEKTGLSVQVVPAAPGATPPPPVLVVPTYAGPGASAVSVAITPRTLTVSTGQAFTFTAVARTAAGVVEGAAPIVFTSSDVSRATVNAATGSGTAGATRGTVTIKAALLSGASESAILTIQPPPTAIVAVSGGTQTATVNAAVTNPVIVQVNAADGLPVPGVTVTFAAQNGGTVGTAAATATATTGTDGRAQTTWRLGSTAGAQTLTVTSSGLTGSPLTFTATATAGAATAIVADSGNSQTGTVGTALANTFVVRVTDALGNAVTGTPVIWAVVTGGGTLGSTTSTTDANGRVRATLTLGAVPSANTVTATSSGLTGSPLTFTATGTVGAATRIVADSGNSQNCTVGTALGSAFVARVTDALGNAVTGTTVTWAVAGGGGTLSNTTSTTDATGRVRATLTLGSVPGANTVTATSSGLTGSPLTFTATGTVGAATRIVADSGNSQSGTVGTALSSAFVARVTDALGNAVTGTTVTWAVAGGGGTLGSTTSTTDANGRVRATLTLGSIPGANTVTATSSGLTGSPLTFTATGTVGAATRIVADSGNSQSGTVGTALSSAFVARITDALGNAVAGTTVTWAVAGGEGTLGSTTSTTDANGRVRATLMLGSIPGANTVTATSSGLTGSPLTFTATGTVGAATRIVADSGMGQSGTVGTALGSAFVARVTDALGNAVTGTTVTWAVAGGGGTLGSTTSTTDANGRVRATLTLGSATGAHTVTATSAGLSGSPYTFTATATAGAATKLVFTTTPTSTSAGYPLPTALVAAMDALNNVVPSFTGSVTLAITTNPGGGTLSGVTTVTAVAGIATFPGLSINKTGAGYILTASSGALTAAASSALTISAAPVAWIVADSGDAQTARISTLLPSPIVGRAVDSLGNAVPGVSVACAVSTGGGALSNQTLTTDSAGKFRANWTLGATPGQQTVRLTSGVIPPLTFTATAIGAPHLAFSMNPANAVAGMAFGTTPVVTARDSVGNTVSSFTGNVTIAMAGAGGYLLYGGPVTVAAVAGVATFPGLSFNRSGVGYTLTASGGPFTSATSAVFNVTNNVAYAIRAEYGGYYSAVVRTPLATPFVAKVTDFYDNPVPGAAVTWAVTAGGGSLAGITSTTDAAGLVQATLTVGAMEGTNSVTATSGSLVGSPATFTANAIAAPRLYFTTQPPYETAAGAALNPVVTVRDPSYNILTSFNGDVTIAIGANPASGTLAGTVTRAAVAGVASFPGLSIDKAGAWYSLTASSGAFTPATSSDFRITPGAATTIEAVSGNGQTGEANTELAVPFFVKVTDAYGNAVSGTAVTWAVTAGGGTFSLTTWQTNSEGIAQNRLRLGPVAGANSVTATSGSLSGSPLTFTATATGATQLAFTTSPTNTAAGVMLNPVVTARDASGNTATSFTGNVTIAIGTNPGGGILSNNNGSLTVSAVAGVATFTGLSINKAGVGYTLAATSNGLTSATSAPFTITHADSRTISPVGATVLAAQVNAALAAPFVAKVTDWYGNPVPGATVTWAISAGGGSLSGTTSTTDADGLVRTTLTLGLEVGAVNSVTATNPTSGSAAGPMTTFSVTGTTQLVFTTNPANAVAGMAFGTTPVVTARDASGNTLTSFTGNVKIAIAGAGGDMLYGGAVTVAAVAGVATFPGLYFNRSGVGYTLTASYGEFTHAFTSATSAAFNVANSVAYAIRAEYGGYYSAVVRTPLATPFVAKVTDFYDNPVPGVAVTWAVTAGGGSLAGITSTTDAAGLVQATLTLGSEAGTNSVTATSGSLVGSPATFTANAVAAPQLYFTTQPPNETAAGAGLNPVVTVRDAGYNTLTSFTGDVTITIGANPASGTLAGTVTRAAVAGVATFPGLSIDKAGAWYRLTASSGAFTPGTSSDFRITPGAATTIAALDGNGQTGEANAELAVPFLVKVTDAYGNAVQGTAVTWAVTAGGGSLSIGTGLTASDGITYARLRLGPVAGANTVTATSGSLSGSPLTFTATATGATQLVFTTSPATTAAGVAMAPVITARDASGNTATSFTGNVTIAIGTNTGGGTLSGTATVAAVAGVATFPGLSINKTGVGYTLAATSSGLTSATSAAFSITPGAAFDFLLVSGGSQSAEVNTALAAPFVAKVTDNSGNGVPGTSVTWAVTSGGGSLAGMTSTTDADGLVQATLTLGSEAGVNSVSATSAAPSSRMITFTAHAVALPRLWFTTQPTDASAGVALNPVVTVRDASNNTLTSFNGDVTIAIGTNPGSGTLAGTLTRAAVAGVASFPGLSIDKAGDGYTLTASSGAFSGATSSAFRIWPGAATTITAHSGSGQTGEANAELATAFVAKATDAFGNPVSGVTVAWAVAAGGGSLTSSTYSTNGSGLVQTVLRLGPVAGANSVTATSGSLSGSPLTFTATATGATQLVVTTSPSNTVAGVAFSPTPVVTARDASGNTATSFTGTVTIAIGTNTGGGTLSGTATVAAVAGVATFTGLSINKTGVGYTLAATSSGLTSATSAPFSITPGTAYTFEALSGGGQSVAVNTALAAPFVAKVTDWYGNPVPGTTVTWAVASGGGSLGGTTSTTDAAGLVQTTLTVGSEAGANSVTATSIGLSGSPLTFTATATAQLVFTTSPVNTAAGVALAPIVTARDATGNTLTSFTGNVRIAIVGDVGGTLLYGGPATVAAVAGVATFTGLSINKAGVGYTLTATSSGLTSATSAPFSITPGAAYNLLPVSGGSQSAEVNTALAAPFVAKVKDFYDNPVPGATVVWAVTAGGGSLAGTTSTTDAAGLVQATLTVGSTVGALNSVTATSGSLVGSPATFTANAVAAPQLYFTTQPPYETAAGAGLNPVVTVRDASNNTLTSFNGDVTIAIGANPASGTLAGTVTRAAVAGVATFPGLSIDKAGAWYTLTASSGAFTPATSSDFRITPGAATTITAVSGNGQTGEANADLAVPFLVKVTDAYGNAVAGTAVTWAVTSGGGSLNLMTWQTNSEGFAQARLQLGPGAGANTVTVTSGSLTGSPLTFTATATGATQLVFTTSPSSTGRSHQHPSLPLGTRRAIPRPVSPAP